LSDLADSWARCQTQFQQVAPHQQRFRRTLPNFQLPCSRDKPLLRARIVPALSGDPLSVTTQRISSGHSIQQLKFALACEPTKGAVANLLAFLVKLTWL
jgi:hypothetical protein